MLESNGGVEVKPRRCRVLILVQSVELEIEVVINNK